MKDLFSFGEFSYHKNNKIGKTTYYKCSRHNADRCPARLTVSEDKVTLRGIHICKLPILSETNIIQPDITPDDFIKNYIEEKASKIDLLPNKIFQDLLSSLREKFLQSPYIIPSKKTVYSRIREVRGLMNMNTILSVQEPPFCFKNNNQPFFRRFWNGDINGEYHKVMIWCTNECLSLMRYNSHTFIDATFRSTPAPFIQCLIIMTYDHGTELYVPCVFALMTGKNEYLYSVVLHEIIFLIEFKWMPKYITTDFEQALIKAINYEFPQSHLTGCYFHLKQAINKKLQKFQVSYVASNIILSNIELLTMVKHDDIPDAINYIKSLIHNESQLEKFWNYFNSIWLKRFESSMWNISKIMNDETFTGRTNNALERYNRRLNEQFSTPHPNIGAFVEKIRLEFEFFEEKCREVRQNSSGIIYREQNQQNQSILSEFENYKNNLLLK